MKARTVQDKNVVHRKFSSQQANVNIGPIRGRANKPESLLQDHSYDNKLDHLYHAFTVVSFCCVLLL